MTDSVRLSRLFGAHGVCTPSRVPRFLVTLPSTLNLTLGVWIMATSADRHMAISALIDRWISPDSDCKGSILKWESCSFENLINEINDLKQYGRSEKWVKACNIFVMVADRCYVDFVELHFPWLFEALDPAFGRTVTADYFTPETAREFVNAIKYAIFTGSLVVTRAA